MTSSNSFARRPVGRQPRPSSAKMVYNGKLFEVWQWEQILYNGSKTVFETLRRPDTVLILPVLSDGQVILAEETQPGMLPMLHSLGGRIELDELPEDAAHRELLEESGYEAQELRLWDAWQPINKIDWAVYLYVAHGLRATSSASPDAGEQIVLRNVSSDVLLERNSDLVIDDYELLHKLYFARADERERDRVLRLLAPGI